MNVNPRFLVPALFALSSFACGASDLDPGSAAVTAPGSTTQLQQELAASVAVESAKVHIGNTYGDPGEGWLRLRVNFNDEALRRLYPEFDGLEGIYADVPGLAKRQWLRFYKTESGTDVHGLMDTFYAGTADAHRFKDVVFGFSTNVGEFHDVARARHTDVPF